MATLCSRAAAVICWSTQSKKEKKKKGRKLALWAARGKYRETFLLLGMPRDWVRGVCCHPVAQPAPPWAACDFLPKWKNKTEKRETDKSPSCRRCPMALLLSALWPQELCHPAGCREHTCGVEMPFCSLFSCVELVFHTTCTMGCRQNAVRSLVPLSRLVATPLG